MSGRISAGLADLDGEDIRHLRLAVISVGEDSARLAERCEDEHEALMARRRAERYQRLDDRLLEEQKLRSGDIPMLAVEGAKLLDTASVAEAHVLICHDGRETACPDGCDCPPSAWGHTVLKAHDEMRQLRGDAS